MTIDEYEIDAKLMGSDTGEDVDPELIDLSILEGYEEDVSDDLIEDLGDVDNWEE